MANTGNGALPINIRRSRKCPPDRLYPSRLNVDTSMGGVKMRIFMLLFALAAELGACGITTSNLDQELWARGAESNASSECSAKTCFGY